ncbi:MAG: flagellar biosynthetic protein FliQ [Planctomycetes bacterium]|nr:flagellar biosynthetic protein FliQ [Planctomycetota bacterium]
MNSIDLATEACRLALLMAAQVTVPVLLMGLCVGVLVSIFQAITQIQDQTLSVIPKLLAMGAAIFVLAPWILSEMTAYTRQAFEALLEVVT